MLPLALGCGQCDLDRTGTWWELAFYCVPARAWHSPANESRTTGKTGSETQGWTEGERRRRRRRSEG